MRQNEIILGDCQRIVISCFDKTGNMVKPWAAAGYLCYCVDIQHAPGERIDGNIVYVGADVLDWMPPRGEIAAAFFFPPCTDVAVSGARWFKDKGIGSLIMALRLFEVSVKLAEWCGAPYLIENPVSTVSSYWRKPDYTFHPYEFSDLCADDNYTKKTCLWTGGGFVMPSAQRDFHLGTPDDRIHKASHSQERADFRSATPMGFARAVFDANHKPQAIEKAA